MIPPLTGCPKGSPIIAPTDAPAEAPSADSATWLPNLLGGATGVGRCSWSQSITGCSKCENADDDCHANESTFRHAFLHPSILFGYPSDQQTIVPVRLVSVRTCIRHFLLQLSKRAKLHCTHHHRGQGSHHEVLVTMGMDDSLASQKKKRQYVTTLIHRDQPAVIFPRTLR